MAPSKLVTKRTYPALVENVEDFIAELRVKRVRSAFFVSEQGLQKSGELIDVQGVVPENTKTFEI